MTESGGGYVRESGGGVWLLGNPSFEMEVSAAGSMPEMARLSYGGQPDANWATGGRLAPPVAIRNGEHGRDDVGSGASPPKGTADTCPVACRT